MIFILGINSFIGKNYYLKLKKLKHNVECLSHSDLDKLINIKDSDVLINFCGVNHANSYEEFENGNFLFLKNIIDCLNKNNITPFVIHVSSLMINGFIDKPIEQLPQSHQYFIKSKIAGDNYLKENYPKNNFSIIKPSNIFGYNCQSYYNNILVTLLHEKIISEYKLRNINKNCYRNFLSIDGLCDKLYEVMENKRPGIFNMISNNTVNLEQLIQYIYNNNVPSEITISNGEDSKTNMNDNESINIVINENLIELLKETENKMIKYKKVNGLIKINKLNRMIDTRGDMVEISDLHAQRLYMITINEHSIRGNHYHYKQIENFYINKGRVIFLLSHADDPEIISMHVLQKDDFIIVNPLIIHTLVNDFSDNIGEIFITSTQAFIKGEIPDTKYVNIL